MATTTRCGHCHECGTQLRSVLDGEEWCPARQLTSGARALGMGLGERVPFGSVS